MEWRVETCDMCRMAAPSARPCSVPAGVVVRDENTMATNRSNVAGVRLDVYEKQMKAFNKLGCMPLMT